MAYQCIPLSDKEYKATLKRVLAHPAKSIKYAQFKERCDIVTKAIKQLEALGPSDHLPALLEPMKKDQKTCQEGMAKLLDSEFRARQKELKRTVPKTPRSPKK